MISVGVFTSKFYPEGSGGDLATYLILKNLSTSRDLQFTVFTGSKSHAIINNVSINYMPLLDTKNILHAWFNIIMHREVFLKLIKKFDVIYIPGFLYPLVDLAKNLNKKVVIHLHGYLPISITSVVYRSDLFKYDKSIITDMRRIAWYCVAQNNYKCMTRIPSALLLPLIRSWLRKADNIIVVSKKQHEILSSAFPYLSHKMKVIYNPPPEINIEGKELTERPRFIYLGGDSYIKGFSVLAKALHEICIKRMLRNGADFVLVNKYSSKSITILNKISKLCKHSHKIYPLDRRVSHDEVISLLRNSWALLLPSRCEEPLPYAVVESMLSGTLPIASSVGGIEEIVPSSLKEILLTDPSPDEIVEKVDFVANLDKATVMELGYKLMEHAKKMFDVNVTKNELVRILVT